MTDKELVSQVLNGNQHACRFLVARYQNLVNHIVRRILLRNDVAEDICQDVFMKVFSKIRNFRCDSKLSTWVASIAYHTALTEYKKYKTIKETTLDHPGLLTIPVTWNSGSGMPFETDELKRILLETIETIPVHYRTILTLYYLEEFSYREIGMITGMPEGTVKNYLYRARFLLKGKLEKIQENERAEIFII